MGSWFAGLVRWARIVRRDALALYLAARDPRLPWLVKGFAALTAAYALSPIDLVPDFIPVLGHLDDLILLPLAIFVLVRLIGEPRMAQYRAAAEAMAERPVSRRAAWAIGCVWLAAAVLAAWTCWGLLTL